MLSNDIEKHFSELPNHFLQAGLGIPTSALDQNQEVTVTSPQAEEAGQANPGRPMAEGRIAAEIRPKSQGGRSWQFGYAKPSSQDSLDLISAGKNNPLTSFESNPHILCWYRASSLMPKANLFNRQAGSV